MNQNPEITFRWLFRPPRWHGKLVFFVRLTGDGKAVLTDFSAACEGGPLDREHMEKLFRQGLLHTNAAASMVLPEYEIPVTVSLDIESLIMGCNGFGIYGVDEADKAPSEIAASHACELDARLAAEVDPQIERFFQERLVQTEYRQVEIVPAAPPAALETAASRVVGYWILFLEWAKCPAHYGVFVRNTGAVDFYDMFTHALKVDADSTAWFERLLNRNIYENFRGDEADEICKYTRRISADRSLIELILRANRHGVTWIKEPTSLGKEVNARLENIFWRELAHFMPYRPAIRTGEGDPMVLLPGPDLIIRNDPSLP